MTLRLRILAAAVPSLAAALLVLGSRCSDAAHPLFLYAGLVHADEGCASGMALGPSTLQLIGLAALILIGAAANSAAVHDAVGALIDRLSPSVTGVLLPPPVPIAAVYSERITWGEERGSGSRDPPVS